MKINTSKILTVITFLLVNMILLTSCKGNISNQTNLETTSSETTETTAITKTTSTEEITQPTVAETTTAESTTTESEPIKYTYQLPEEVKNIHWSTDDIIRPVFGDIQKISFEELDSSIQQAMKGYVLPNVSELYYGENGHVKESEVFYIVDTYDLNDDGTEDYFIHGGECTDAIYPLFEVYYVFVSQKNGTYKPIKWDQTLWIEACILKTKTNGINDIKVLRNSSDPVIRYDGKDSYSEMPYVDEMQLFIDDDTVKINNRIFNFDFIALNGKPSGKYYVVMKLSDDTKLKEDVICSCEADGTPIMYTDDYKPPYGTGYKFYAELNENYEIPEDIQTQPLGCIKNIVAA